MEATLTIAEQERQRVSKVSEKVGPHLQQRMSEALAAGVLSAAAYEVLKALAVLLGVL